LPVKSWNLIVQQSACMAFGSELPQGCRGGVAACYLGHRASRGIQWGRIDQRGESRVGQTLVKEVGVDGSKTSTLPGKSILAYWFMQWNTEHIYYKDQSQYSIQGCPCFHEYDSYQEERQTASLCSCWTQGIPGSARLWSSCHEKAQVSWSPGEANLSLRSRPVTDVTMDVAMVVF